MALETKIIINLIIIVLKQSKDLDTAIELITAIANSEGVNVADVNRRAN